MKIVFPVRFAACRGQGVQTTSMEITDSGVLVMCGRRPSDDLVTVQLYLPDSRSPAGAIGKVCGPRDGGLWLELVDTVRGVSERVQALVSWAAARLNQPAAKAERSPHRAMPRYPTSMPVALESAGRLIAAKALNVSASGLFVYTCAPIDVGTVVGVRLGLPDRDRPVSVQAKVVHQSGADATHWTEPGLGLQFVDGDDTFRARIDRHLARLAVKTAPPK